MASMRIYLKDEFRWTFTLLDPEVRMGRARDNHIVLPGANIAPHHAILQKRGRQFCLLDKTDKGIFVNRKIMDRAFLQQGDLIQIGDYGLTFQTDEDDEPLTHVMLRESAGSVFSTPPFMGPDRAHQVVVMDGPDQGKRCPLTTGKIRIGRNARNDFVLTDQAVSSFHLEIEATPKGVQLYDVGSTNGTRVGGREVMSAIIEMGVEIQIGQTRLSIASEKPSTASEQGQAAGLGAIVGQSPAMEAVFKLIQKGAASDLPILILGETGSGKERVAHEVHRLSARAQGAFITVDCSTIPKELMESELFGHEKGAFTGATAQRKGAFELARGGTVFLDEIGELPLEMQPKLLRVLEEQTFKRVGGNERIHSNFRIIAATNRGLNHEVACGRFRQDLYFRLFVFPILLPPLRERKEDISLFLTHFLRGKSIQVTDDALKTLMRYSWPGNVREFRNVIERALVVCDGNRLRMDDILFLEPPEGGYDKERSVPVKGSGESLEEIEKREIRRVLDVHDGDKKAAAKALGISLSTLYEKLKQYR